MDNYCTKLSLIESNIVQILYTTNPILALHPHKKPKQEKNNNKTMVSYSLGFCIILSTVGVVYGSEEGIFPGRINEFKVGIIGGCAAYCSHMMKYDLMREYLRIFL